MTKSHDRFCIDCGCSNCRIYEEGYRRGILDSQDFAREKGLAEFLKFAMPPMSAKEKRRPGR